MKTTLTLAALAAVSCSFAQVGGGADRSERELGRAEGAKAQGAGGGGKFDLSVVGRYGLTSGDGFRANGPSVTLGINPGSSNGMLTTNLTYKYNTIYTFPGHVFKDLVVADVQLVPNSFPIMLNGTYTYSKVRQGMQFTGFGATASKVFKAPFLFAEGQRLELGITGTQERFSGPNVRTVEGLLWDASATLYDIGGLSMTFDYAFKSDVEGPSNWFLQTRFPLSNRITGRLLVAEGNTFGFDIGFRFK